MTVKKVTFKTNRLAELRASKGLTQQKLADLVGSHWITISKLERGKMRLTDEWLIKLSEAMKVEPYDLLPNDRALTTVHVVGEVFPNGELSYYELSEPRRNTLYNSLFHHHDVLWFYSNTDSLAPFFKDGDLLAFRMAEGFSPSEFKGRICLFWVMPGPRTIIGVLQDDGPKRFTIRSLDNEILKDAHIINFAPMSMFIANNEDVFKDGLFQEDDT